MCCRRGSGDRGKIVWLWVEHNRMTTRLMSYRRTSEGDVMVASPQLALPIDATVDGEIRTYRFVLPYLPPSKNVYANWPGQWKSSAKAKWRRDLERFCDEQMVPKGMQKIGLAAVLVFPTNARRDPQNYAEALWHWVPDGLVRAGVVVDDNDGRIEIGRNWGLTMQVDTRKGVPAKVKSRTILSLSMFIADPAPVSTGGDKPGDGGW